MVGRVTKLGDSVLAAKGRHRIWDLRSGVWGLGYGSPYGNSIIHHSPFTAEQLKFS